ncbi:Fc.00g066780.m01.CDS01 [Cosmosporella sp. VM-42]
MHLAVLLAWFIGVVATLHGQSVASKPHRRDFPSCEQTYGVTWVQCNGEKDTSCYNPGLGQYCCVAGINYFEPAMCHHGDFYCAPSHLNTACWFVDDLQARELPGLVGHELPDGTKTVMVTVWVTSIVALDSLAATAAAAPAMTSIPTTSRVVEAQTHQTALPVGTASARFNVSDGTSSTSVAGVPEISSQSNRYGAGSGLAFAVMLVVLASW